ncbi:hypothetical protein HRJ35_03530 [Shewanella oneidensis MR-1]|nr:hypothetical protein [Shewanella oneidensis]MDX5997830.1 hypothetical protein [Shewanella oneidensis]QKG95159.1 hypothetical protein HRJ35_03530 [Shewanella oneidensis MR-1]
MKLIASAIGISLLPLSFAVSAQSTPQPAAKIAEAKDSAPEPPSGWMIIDEVVWLRFVDEPTQHLISARDSFVKGDFEHASDEVCLAAGYLHIAVRKADKKSKSALTKSAQELDTLSSELHSNKATTLLSIDQVFARAVYALAADHQAKVRIAMQARNYKTAGHYLHSAVTEVEQAAKWSGHELEYSAAVTAKDTRVLAGKMVEGTGYVVDEVGKGVEWAGTEIEKLGRVIEPGK